MLINLIIDGKWYSFYDNFNECADGFIDYCLANYPPHREDWKEFAKRKREELNKARLGDSTEAVYIIEELNGKFNYEVKIELRTSLNIVTKPN